MNLEIQYFLGAQNYLTLLCFFDIISLPINKILVENIINMNVDNKDEVLTVMEFVKSANLKGTVEIIGEHEFLWNLGGIFLRFLIDSRETTVLYSRRKSHFFEIGHFHEDNCEVLSLIQEINSEDKRVHIAVLLGGSNFDIEYKTEKKKKSWLVVRHYYSEL